MSKKISENKESVLVTVDTFRRSPLLVLPGVLAAVIGIAAIVIGSLISLSHHLYGHPSVGWTLIGVGVMFQLFAIVYALFLVCHCPYRPIDLARIKAGRSSLSSQGQSEQGQSEQGQSEQGQSEQGESEQGQSEQGQIEQGQRERDQSHGGKDQQNQDQIYHSQDLGVQGHSQSVHRQSHNSVQSRTDQGQGRSYQSEVESDHRQSVKGPKNVRSQQDRGQDRNYQG